jgi:ABC-type glycerol-3-phosphate transport system substrate-binding protein
MVGKLQSDLAYMNYMMASTDNLISSSRDPATVLAYGAGGVYGVNGTYSVDGLELYLKMKGEGWVQSTVDTDGGGEANAIFGGGNASMVYCGPWGTSIFEGAGLTNFSAVPMPASPDGPSTIIGGGMSLVPELPGTTNADKVADAVTLAQELLEDEHQMKTVDNWLGTAWRIPVRTSVTEDAWFTAFENRSNFLMHVESLDYAYAWGKQHPDWMTVHEAVMMPGYLAAVESVDYDTTGQNYRTLAQAALDEMAATIQFDYLIVQGKDTVVKTVVDTVEITVKITDHITVTKVVTSIVRVSGFSILLLLSGIAPYILYRKRK